MTQLSAERDAADAARTEFAEYMENITHQLKTPVTSMMLMADLLEAAPPERQEEFLANIRTSLARMNWLVDTLLKLAKLNAGAVQFERAAVTAQALVGAGASAAGDPAGCAGSAGGARKRRGAPLATSAGQWKH